MVSFSSEENSTFYVILLRIFSDQQTNQNPTYQDATVGKWKAGKVNPDFIDNLNFTLSCGTECPLSLATFKGFFFNADLQYLYMIFDVPHINPDMKLVEADPFKLTRRTNSETCTVN